MVEAVYRADSRRVLATLIRLLGDFDLAEEALHDAFAAALEQLAARRRARQPARVAGLDRPLQGDRRAAPAGPVRRVAAPSSPTQLDAGTDDAARGRRRGVEDDRLRLIFTCCHPALPPDAPGRAHAARGLRPHHRGDRPRLPDARADAWPSASSAPRPRSATRGIPYQVPAPRRAARPARRVLARGLPRLQRGLLGVVRRVAHPARPLGRGDPARPAAGRAAAGARGGRACSR